MITLVCKTCGTSFERPVSQYFPERNPYCCWDCYMTERLKDNTILYVPCDVCGTILRTTKKTYDTKKNHYCGRACYATARTKEKPKKENKSDRISATRGHKKGKNTRKFCTYTVYDAKTDNPVAVDVTAEEAAKAMGITVNSFYGNIKRIADGKNKKWWIERIYLEGEEIYA